MISAWMILVLIFVGRAVNSEECTGEMKGKCFCGKTLFEDRIRFIVNCTNVGFTTTTPLQNLPLDIEVLIFTGNKIAELPWNVFGTLQNFSNLRVVDMSNNAIEEVKGKAYHHVPNVHRLILNHNDISISEDFHHPRIFSNFVNLEELHLTNAFEDNASNLGIDLHDIFISSNLTKLIKLHLEQNEVSTFQDKKVFCDLPQLMDLHLGDNKLTDVSFEIACLHNLRYIDLERNQIVTLSVNDLKKMDDLPARGQPLTVNLSNNSLLCAPENDAMFTWLSKTAVNIVGRQGQRNDSSQCSQYVHGVSATPAPSTSPLPHTFLILCVLIAIFSAIILIYYRDRIKKKILPMVNSVSRKVQYSTIGNNDDQEVAV